MSEPTIQLGGGSWAGKSNSLLGFSIQNGRFYAQEFTFNRTTTGTYTDSDGYIQNSAANIPRVDYKDNSNGSLILEPQRTNIETKSNSFSTWSNISNATATSDYIVSPDGTQNATRLQFTSNGYISNSSQDTSSTLFTISCYAKRNDSGTQTVGFFTNGSGVVNSTWSLTSNWQRFTYTYTSTNTSLIGIAGGTGADVSVFGFQIEKLESYPTSYIPTSGSSVTRNADTSSISNVADRINSSEGVLFADIAALDNDSTYRLISIENTSDAANNFIYLGYDNSSNTIRTRIEVAGSAVTDMQFALSDETEFNKCAVKWNENDFALWVNGVEVATDSSGSTFSSNALDRLSFNRNSTLEFLGNVKQLQVYNTALSDSELAVLTGGTAAVYNWVDSSSNIIVNENGDTIIFT